MEKDTSISTSRNNNRKKNSEWTRTLSVRVCPVTNGNPTSMTENSFHDACDRQSKPRDKSGFGPRQHRTNIYEQHCKQCGGVCPPELTIINNEDIKKMGNVTTYQGTCELCGKDGKTLRKVFDKKVCSACEPVRRAAHNSPGVVVSQLVEAKGQQWLSGLLKMTDIPPANVLDLEGEIKTLTAAVATAKAANGDIADRYGVLSDEAEDLREANKNLNQERLDLLAEIEKLRNDIQGTLTQNFELIQEIEQLQQKLPTASQTGTVSRDNILRAINDSIEAGHLAFPAACALSWHLGAVCGQGAG